MPRMLPWIMVLALTPLGELRTDAEEPSPGERPLVLTVSLQDQSITPITARFLLRAIERAEFQRADCLIIVLDTPGGLVDSTRELVKGILRSEVPIVVYVAPSGARAASAGVFVSLAAHVTAMAPGTNLGAAYPVQIGGLPGTPPGQPERPQEDGGDPSPIAPLESKSVNDTVAWARALAELRERDAEWATQAVKESRSSSASEAVEAGIVDFLAENLDDLLEQLEGRTVALPRDRVTLRTTDAEVREIEMWWGESILAVLTHPNVAFLLLILGFYGVLLEFYSPGWGVSGTLGVICLLLGFFALAVLPINYAGLLLIFVALALFVAEVFVVSFGALTVAGVACLVLGGMMLVDSPIGFLRVSLHVVIPVAVATAVITIFLVGGIVRAHRQRVLTGGVALIGLEAIAQDDFVSLGKHYTGLVRSHGELWKAVSDVPVQSGAVLEVLNRQGLTLQVRSPDRPTENQSM